MRAAYSKSVCLNLSKKKSSLRKTASYQIFITALFFCLSSHAATPAEECNRLYDEGLMKLAIPLCTRAAEADNRPSQTILGEIYNEQGDSEKTATWWGRASNAGYQPARNLLAMKYYYGGSVFGQEPGWDQDFTAAFKLWSEDAKQGIASSQFMTGLMYFNGEGVEKNLSEAWFWLNLALENGYKLATDVLIEVSRAITPDQKQIAIIKLSTYRKDENRIANE